MTAWRTPFTPPSLTFPILLLLFKCMVVSVLFHNLSLHLSLTFSTTEFQILICIFSLNLHRTNSHSAFLELLLCHTLILSRTPDCNAGIMRLFHTLHRSHTQRLSLTQRLALSYTTPGSLIHLSLYHLPRLLMYLTLTHLSFVALQTHIPGAALGEGSRIAGAAGFAPEH